MQGSQPDYYSTLLTQALEKVASGDGPGSDAARVLLGATEEATKKIAEEKASAHNENVENREQTPTKELEGTKRISEHKTSSGEEYKGDFSEDDSQVLADVFRNLF